MLMEVQYCLFCFLKQKGDGLLSGYPSQHNPLLLVSTALNRFNPSLKPSIGCFSVFFRDRNYFLLICEFDSRSNDHVTPRLTPLFFVLQRKVMANWTNIYHFL